MTKVTQQAWKRRPSGGVPSQAEATDAETTDVASAGEHGEAGGGESEQREIDLKATVTLSGEALAALLEEVKTAQRAAAGRGAETTATDELEQIDEAASVAPAETSDWQALPSPFRRGPQRRSGKT